MFNLRKRFHYYTLEEMIAFGIEFIREDLNEYKWWQFEVRITFIRACLVVRFHPYHV